MASHRSAEDLGSLEKIMDMAWGYAQRVIDGDTFDFDVDSVSRENQHDYGDVERVRVRGIDAAELDEPGGRAAAARLRRRIAGRRIGVRVHARDRYGRLIGEIEPA